MDNDNIKTFLPAVALKQMSKCKNLQNDVSAEKMDEFCPYLSRISMYM